MDDLRRPFFIAAVVLIVLVVLIEIGAGVAMRGTPPKCVPPPGVFPPPPCSVMDSFTGALPAPIKDALGDIDSGEVNDLSSESEDIPGVGIPYMAVLDGMLLFTIGLVASSLIITDRVQGRVQGIATFILSILLILLSIALIISAIILLLLMIALLLAVPFGTIAYLAIYGFFPRGAAAAVLGLTLFLKIVFVVCLVVAQQRFLQNRGLVLLVICSLIANILLSFLHGFVPGFLVSITDAIGGILVALCGCIWWLVALIAAIPAIIRTIQARA